MGRRSRLRRGSIRCGLPEMEALDRKQPDHWQWHGEVEETPAADGDNLTLWHQK